MVVGRVVNIHYSSPLVLRRHPFILHSNTILHHSNRVPYLHHALVREYVLNSLCCCSGSLVPCLYATSTVYAGGITLLFLYLATRASWDSSSRSQGDVFVYSSDELKKSKGRGRRLQLNSGMRYLSSPRMLIRLLFPLIVMYAVLLVRSYEPDMLQLILPGSLKEGLSSGFNPQFFPNITGIATLFSRTATTASLWIHVLCINVFAAHTLMWKGIDMGIPTHHTIVMSMICGPLGFLSHWVTSLLFPRI